MDELGPTRTFVHVVHRGSFSAAARDLKRTCDLGCASSKQLGGPIGRAAP